MKRTIVIISILVVAIATVATPWVIGWRAEQLVRERVAQVDADKTSKFQMQIDRYERGWRGADARISVLDRAGTRLITLPAAIRHWPFASGGPADWIAVPELGATIRDALGPWAGKLPALTTRTQLSWSGNVLTRIESPAFKQRIPEVADGALEVGAIAGTVDWRRDGALTYEIALPVFRIEQQAIGGAGAPDIAEFKEALIKGDGSLGTIERRWNQKGSLAAASVLLTQAGKTVVSATTPMISYASVDEGQHVGMRFAVAASGISAKHTSQNFSDATIEFALDARHIAKEPLGRFLDAAAIASTAPALGMPAPGLPALAATPERLSVEFVDEVLRGSPAADVQLMLKATEGRVDIKLALAFDGLGYDPKIGGGGWLQRLDAELNARASTALVINGVRAAAGAAAGMRPPAPADSANAPPGAPSPVAEAIARQQLAEAATQGWLRIEGNEMATTVLWRKGILTINGKDMSELRDLAQGMMGR